MSKEIEGKVAAHDRHQFELKLGYALDPSTYNNKYNIELYMFIPNSLGINNQTYSKNYFYNDVQGYIRFKTPTFSFEQLADINNQLSPLTRIKSLLEASPKKKPLIAELKLYACTVRVALRDAIMEIRKQIRKSDPTGLKDKLTKTCNELNSCLKELRNLLPKLVVESVHEDVRTAFRHTDEYLGIAIDGLLNSLHNTINSSSLSEGDIDELNKILTPIIISEFNYRKDNNYTTYSLNSENELFLYRKGVLKKIITSILFLKTHTQEGVTLAKDFVFAIAAGIAMVIATAVTLWAGHRYGSTSIPFVLAIVVGYMAKDRIKDWLKYIFSKKMTRWFADLKTDILDPANDSKIGVCKHAFSFIPEKNIPQDITKARRQNTSPDFWLMENVIKYEKSVFLKPRLILKNHTRLRNVTDIIRFNIHKFLERMDEPYEIRRAIDPSTGEISEFKCARVYHINIILLLEEKMRRMRLVVDQNGIKRIEEF